MLVIHLKKYHGHIILIKNRIAFSNEMKVDNSIKLNGALIKQLCSGGDKIQTRVNNVNEKRL